jgi:hypothetical protein
MPGPDLTLSWAVPACLSLDLLPSAPVFAYGPAPGMELFPYFMGLLAWAGLALVTALLWPISALRRRFRTRKDAPPAELTSETTSTSESESSRKGNQERA